MSPESEKKRREEGTPHGKGSRTVRLGVIKTIITCLGGLLRAAFWNCLPDLQTLRMFAICRVSFDRISAQAACSPPLRFPHWEGHWSTATPGSPAHSPSLSQAVSVCDIMSLVALWQDNLSSPDQSSLSSPRVGCQSPPVRGGAFVGVSLGPFSAINAAWAPTMCQAPHKVLRGHKGA